MSDNDDVNDSEISEKNKTENHSSGWIKVYKSLLTWEWHDDPATGWLFITLLALANWQETKWRGQIIQRGQILTGRKKLSKQTGLSERQILTSLSKLKTTSQVIIKATNRFSIITICNYDRYQTLNSQSDQQSDQQSVQQAINKRSHLKNNKIYKEDKNITGPRFARPKFNPEGKTKYLDWVHLSDEERRKLEVFYARHGLGHEDLSEAVRQLDAWFENNQHMREKRLSDEKALKGWPMQRAIEAKKNRLSLERAQAPKVFNGPSQFGRPQELPEATKVLLQDAVFKGKLT